MVSPRKPEAVRRTKKRTSQTQHPRRRPQTQHNRFLAYFTSFFIYNPNTLIIMKSAATTNTDDLKKAFQEQLRIDADLANATDVTAPLSFATPVSNRNRTGNDNGEDDDWKTFYERLKKTPPKSTQDIKFGTAVEKANNLLCLSDLEEFASKTFKNLTKDQQAIMMLMVTKKMDEVFEEGGPHQVAKVLVGALKPKTDEYKSLKAFVRAGGDLDGKFPLTSTVVKRFNKARDTFAKGSEDVKTIFDKKEGMMPFLHLQKQTSSYICAFNACAVLLYYCSYDIGDRKAIRANISRYIRDEIDGLKIANLTLITQQKGASLSETLTGLMLSFGTVPPELGIDRICLEENDEDWNYSRLASLLQIGRPFAFLLECFPALDDLKKKQYTGKLSDHFQKQDYGERGKGPQDRRYHAVVCIGIKPRNGTMPPMLLVQDSCDSRPAFQIGLDLLMDMGEENLHFCTLPPYWKPNPKRRYEVNKKTRVHFAGSPVAIDKNDKPYDIISRKEPVQEKRDMSKYLHPPSKPGMPQVYYT